MVNPSGVVVGWRFRPAEALPHGLRAGPDEDLVLVSRERLP